MEEQKFILALAAEGENILHLGPLGEQLAEQVSSNHVTIIEKFTFFWVLMNAMLFWSLMKQDWLNSVNKTLTNHQHRAFMNAMLFWLQVMQEWLNNVNKTLTNNQHRLLMNAMLFWLQVMQEWRNNASKTLTNYQHRVSMNIMLFWLQVMQDLLNSAKRLSPTTNTGSP